MFLQRRKCRNENRDAELPLLASLDTAGEEEKPRVRFGEVSSGADHHVGGHSEDSEQESRFQEFRDEKHVIIDVGGERFQAEKERFLKFPNTRLGTGFEN